MNILAEVLCVNACYSLEFGPEVVHNLLFKVKHRCFLLKTRLSVGSRAKSQSYDLFVEKHYLSIDFYYTFQLVTFQLVTITAITKSNMVWIMIT